MSDNDDIEVESDVSPGASSFLFGLSGGDSGRGSQPGDGGRGPGRRRLRPLPPGLGPPALRPGLAPLQSRPERPPGTEGGSRHAASGTPTSSCGGECRGLPLHSTRLGIPLSVRILGKETSAQDLLLGSTIPLLP